MGMYKTDQVNLPKNLVALTKEKDITPSLNALKAKDEELKVKEQEILLKTRDAHLIGPAIRKLEKLWRTSDATPRTQVLLISSTHTCITISALVHVFVVLVYWYEDTAVLLRNK